MRNPRLQILLSYLFFSYIFSATKRSVRACQKRCSIWITKSLSNPLSPTSSSHSPYNLSHILSVPSLSSIMHTPNGLDIFSLSRQNFPVSKEMEESVRAVENIVGYQFKNKRLLEEALTHSSYTESNSYQRLEFIGDAALGCALSNYVFLAYPSLDPGQLSLLRAANISTEKLARVAIRHGLYQYVRHNAAALDDKVREFALAIQDEDDAVTYGGSVKAPKILADIVESVAAAIYVDCSFDLQGLWVIFRGLLEPIVTLEDLQLQPQPVTMLFELCQKDGKQVDIKHWRKGMKNIASVYVDGKFIASSSTEQKETAKLYAAKEALRKLSELKSNDIEMLDSCKDFNGAFEIEGAKQKLHELCGKKKWPKPSYSSRRIEKEDGPAHDRIFICSVQIETIDGTLFMLGDKKSRVKDAENSAASLMLRALMESNYLGGSSM